MFGWMQDTEIEVVFWDVNVGKEWMKIHTMLAEEHASIRGGGPTLKSI